MGHTRDDDDELRVCMRVCRVNFSPLEISPLIVKGKKKM